jgi:hypothetical protein
VSFLDPDVTYEDEKLRDHIRGVIPADRWYEPYMPWRELDHCAETHPALLCPTQTTKDSAKTMRRVVVGRGPRCLRHHGEGSIAKRSYSATTTR